MNIEDVEKLKSENEMLRKDNEQLLAELKNCRDDLNSQIEVITAVKKELRRYEVQINSLKNENEEFKNKFARIENNPLGQILLKIYRWLRELKRRRGQ